MRKEQESVRVYLQYTRGWKSCITVAVYLKHLDDTSMRDLFLDLKELLKFESREWIDLVIVIVGLSQKKQHAMLLFELLSLSEPADKQGNKSTPTCR